MVAMELATDFGLSLGLGQQEARQVVSCAMTSVMGRVSMACRMSVTSLQNASSNVTACGMKDAARMAVTTSWASLPYATSVKASARGSRRSYGAQSWVDRDM